MSYKSGFQERAYWIMQQKESGGKSLAEIAQMLGITHSAVNQSYRHAKSRRSHLYLRAVCEATGKSCDELLQLYKRLHEEYGEDNYISAYLEKEYGELLSVFREGEPGVPDVIIQKLPPLRGIMVLNYDRSKTELSQEEIIVMDERGKKKSFAEIGTILGITDAKAQRIYVSAKYTLMNRDIAIICKKTGQTREMFIDFLHRNVSGDFRRWQKYIDKEYGIMLQNANNKCLPSEREQQARDTLGNTISFSRSRSLP